MKSTYKLTSNAKKESKAIVKAIKQKATKRYGKATRNSK